MSKKGFYLGNIGLLALGLVGCNGGGSSTPSSSPPTNNIPASFQCLPSQLPSISSTGLSTKIAYAGNCAVAVAPESVALQSMAVALDGYESTTDKFYGYCTGIPIKYNESTGVGFILTAAHCVTGGSKSANAPTTESNITSFNVAYGHNSAWIYQGAAAGPVKSSVFVAQMRAVYVPSQYCQVPGFGNSGCSDLSEANGDFAVLKVNVMESQALAFSESVALAPSNLTLTSFSYILGLGYGGTNPNGTPLGQNPDNNDLNYMNYQYFGTNSFNGVSATIANMNGYSANGGYYSILCGGDSGGGDFVWTGSGWDLVGVHSYIIYPLNSSLTCGAYNASYNLAANVSADVRQFNIWINNVLINDTESSGCATLDSAYACESGSAQ